MKRMVVLSLALILVLSAVAMADGIGAFSAFKNGVGARALAMGGAFVAVANDATAACWNPAGLATLNDTRLAGMSTDLYGLGATHQYVGAVTTIANLGIGLGWERAAIDGQAMDGTGTPGATFTWTEQAIVGSLATNVMDVAMAGANVKYYMADSGLGDTASGFGFDLGVLVSLGDMFVIGVNAKDLAGSGLAWDGGANDVISGLYKAGLAMKLAEDKLVLATDVDFDNSGLGDTHVGVEFQVIDELALRGGVVLTNNFQDYYLQRWSGSQHRGSVRGRGVCPEPDAGEHAGAVGGVLAGRTARRGRAGWDRDAGRHSRRTRRLGRMRRPSLGAGWRGHRAPPFSFLGRRTNPDLAAAPRGNQSGQRSTTLVVASELVSDVGVGDVATFPATRRRRLAATLQRSPDSPPG